MNFDTISVVGMGYIGLPTAAAFAARKKKVIGIDVNQDAVETINRGEIHIVEPDLDMVVHAAVTEGFLRATSEPEAADAFLIAVPTPFTGDHVPDLSYIKAASQAIATVLKPGNIVVLESTSPVGATEQMSAWMAEVRPDLSFPHTHGEESEISVAHCPERVLPGHVMRELIENDRVIGGLTRKCSLAAVQLYKIFVQGECLITDARTAEMAKLTENSYRDVNIAFANELSLISDKLDIDVWNLIKLANRHPRVNILQPGPGVGGHCIAVDPWFIVSEAPDEARLIRVAREVNDSKPEWVIEKVKIALADHLQNNQDKTAKDIIIACYGIAFKPDIDDLRESPAMRIVQTISEIHSGGVLVIEPNIQSLPNILEDVELVQLGEDVIVADIHLLLVEHKQFRKYIPDNGTIIDMKGVWVKQGVD